jgi:hypothetical protein
LKEDNSKINKKLQNLNSESSKCKLEIFKKENIFSEKLQDCSGKLDSLIKMKNERKIDDAEKDVDITMIEVLLFLNV